MGWGSDSIQGFLVGSPFLPSSWTSHLGPFRAPPHQTTELVHSSRETGPFTPYPPWSMSCVGPC